MTYTKDNIVFEPLPTGRKFVNLTDDIFGRLTVLGFAGIVKNHRYWWCECECGNVTRVDGGNLKSGNSHSCRCLQYERTSIANSTHGQSKTPEYRAFRKARERCESPQDKRWDCYGARGIEFRFDSFEEFLAHIGQRPSAKLSLDRIDVNGHYEVGNLRWATARQQAQNRRFNRLVTVGDTTLCVAEWTRQRGLPLGIVAARLDRKWCDECSILPTHSQCIHIKPRNLSL